MTITQYLVAGGNPGGPQSPISTVAHRLPPPQNPVHPVVHLNSPAPGQTGSASVTSTFSKQLTPSDSAHPEPVEVPPFRPLMVSPRPLVIASALSTAPASAPSIVIASEARQSRRRRRRRPRNATANYDTTPLPYSELMLYNGFTGDKSVPSTRFRAFTANQHQVATGLCRRLSPTTLIGAVPSATAPATARHASGMENESKKPQRTTSGRRADTARNLVKHSKPSPVHLESSEEVHSNTNANTLRRQRSIACPLPPPNSDTRQTRRSYLQPGRLCPGGVSMKRTRPAE